MKKLQLSLCLLLIFLSASVGATIKIGTVFFYPPFVISPGTGFDMDLSKVLCKRMRQSCEFISMDFNQLFDALVTGKIDIAIGGIPVSNAQPDKFIFSLPYMLSKGQFLVQQDSTLTSIDQLVGKVVGVVRGEGTGGLFYNYLISHFPGQSQIILYNDIDTIITALNKGTIAAALIHRATAIYWEQNSTNQFRELGKSMFIGQGIGILSTPRNQALINLINRELIAMESDDSYMAIYSEYFANE